MSQKQADILSAMYNPKRKKTTNEAINSVPAAVVRRMPRYFRYLRDLLNNDILRISSGDLAKLMGTTPSQIRQDFNCFGDFGQQGYGYNVKFLYTQISRILCVNKKFPAVIIGSGEIAQALLNSSEFDIRGIRIKGVFDTDIEKVGSQCAGFEVLHIDHLNEFCKNTPVFLAVIASVNADESVCETVRQSGIKGIWNFSCKEFAPKGIKCKNVMFGDSLMLLMYEIGEADNNEEG